MQCSTSLFVDFAPDLETLTDRSGSEKYVECTKSHCCRPILKPLQSPNTIFSSSVKTAQPKQIKKTLGNSCIGLVDALNKISRCGSNRRLWRRGLFKSRGHVGTSLGLAKEGRLESMSLLGAASGQTARGCPKPTGNNIDNYFYYYCILSALLLCTENCRIPSTADDSDRRKDPALFLMGGNTDSQTRQGSKDQHSQHGQHAPSGQAGNTDQGGEGGGRATDRISSKLGAI